MDARFDAVAIELGAVVVVVVAALVAQGLVFAIARRFLDTDQARELLFGGRWPARWAFIAVGLQILLWARPPHEGLLVPLRHVLTLSLVAAVGWAAVAVVRGSADIVQRAHDLRTEDNLEARAVYTRVRIIQRTLISLIVVVTLATGLMTFPAVREIGTTLFVSAGFAGLAVGLAARPVLENLIAGLQLAFTQPIRFDDVVIVEGEWGRIEEITATYVVVRVWDERRLVVPLARFIHQPFQNWTRQSSQIMGTVFLWVDYTVPVDDVRGELERLCRASPFWDERVCKLQVTDATDRAVQLRCLVSAADASKAWDLRVHLREALIGYLQREHPGALPRARVLLEEGGSSAMGSAPSEAPTPPPGT